MSGLFRPESVEHQSHSWLGGIQLVRPVPLAILTGLVACTAIATGWKTSGTTKSVAKPFEGLLAQALRLYQDSESEFVRKHLTRFMNPSPCPACGGRRLRREMEFPRNQEPPAAE